jgi:RNA 2',3'-cyclic 3'-phosphodiesterase
MGNQNEASEQDRRKGLDFVRAFICIEMPSAIKERINDLQRALKKNQAHISWVKSSNIHLTIKFLGDVQASKIQSAIDALARATQSTGEFEIEVGGAGCFPSPKNPRVLWVGLSRLPEPLAQLHSNIENEFAREGFPREQKRYSPHLTIGRVRAPLNAAKTADDLIATGFEPHTFKAAEVILMRSDLNPSGSIYTPLAVSKLGASN